MVGDQLVRGHGRDRDDADRRRLVPVGAVQVITWTVALLMTTRSGVADASGCAAWRVAVAHFAERYGLFVIICLGESIVAIGLCRHATDRRAARDGGRAWTRDDQIGLWWTCFTASRGIAEQGCVAMTMSCSPR
jgi:low temperature requirement protein LtrA